MPEQQYTYKVKFKRTDWKKCGQKIFAFEAAAERFIARLENETGRVDLRLAPVTWELYRRPVGAWKVIDRSGRRS